MPQGITFVRACLTVAVLTVLGLITPGSLQAQTLEESLRDYSMECEPDVVKDLLQQGADPDAADEDGYSALIWAAGAGCNDTVAVLLEAGADPNLTNSDGNTPLIEAVLGDGYGEIEEMHEIFAEIAELLLEAGADAEAQDADGKTALDHAREFGLGHLVEILQ